jgi:thiamine biosynthesis lipoprotein
MRKRPMVVKATRFCRRVTAGGRAVLQVFRDERPWSVKGPASGRQFLAYLQSLRLSPAQRRFLDELWAHYSLHVIAVLLLVLAVFLLREMGRPSLVLQEIRGNTMGTTYTVQYRTVRTAALTDLEKQNIAAAIGKRLDEVNNLMSNFRPESEISRFNASRSLEPFPLSPRTREVIALSLKVSDLSGGAFDITVGPIVNAYGFGAANRSSDPLTTTTLAPLREYVGYRLLQFDSRASTLAKKDPRVYCDLAAVAKGYGVDQVAEVLDGFELEHYLVEIGGEVRAHGQNDEDRPWCIGILKPLDNAGRDLSDSVGLADLSMATSGDYRNFYRENGKRISHTIDPRTGLPIDHNLASVSVVASTCAEADAWATALMVLGPEEGFEFAIARNLPALFLIRDNSGNFLEKTTPDFLEFLQKKSRSKDGGQTKTPE